MIIGTFNYFRWFSKQRIATLENGMHETVSYVRSTPMEVS